MVLAWTIKHVSLNPSTMPQTYWNISILPYLGYHPMWSCHRLSYQAQGIVISIEICLHLLQKKTRDRGWFVSRRLMWMSFRNNSCPSKGRMTDLWWVAKKILRNRSAVENINTSIKNERDQRCSYILTKTRAIAPRSIFQVCIFISTDLIFKDKTFDKPQKVIFTNFLFSSSQNWFLELANLWTTT